MKERVVTGIFIFIVVAIVLWFSYIPFVICSLAAILSAFGVYELFKATKNLDDEFFCVAAMLFGIAFQFVKIPYYEYFVAVILVIAILMFIYFMKNLHKKRKISALMALVFSFFIAIQYKTLPALCSLSNGREYLCLTLIISSLTDVFAQLVGRRFGKTKLIPTVSPSKTVEGAIGGLVVSVFISIICLELLRNFVPNLIRLPWFLIGAVITSILGQFGDLSMSVIKRMAGVKDYGTFLIGHGGILDRFDSVLFSVPFVFACISFGGVFIL